MRFLVVCPSSLSDFLPAWSPAVSGPSLCPFCRLCLPSCASFGVVSHILAFREPVSLTMNATRSMSRWQGLEWRSSVRRQQQGLYAEAGVRSYFPRLDRWGHHETACPPFFIPLQQRVRLAKIQCDGKYKRDGPPG